MNSCGLDKLNMLLIEVALALSKDLCNFLLVIHCVYLVVVVVS